ncbi:MAG: hypothetical protein ABIN01_15705 [Ferruginibacter sp.]
MKKFFVVIITVCTCFSAISQVAYYDAIELKKIFSAPMNNDTYQEASRILARYLPPNNTDTTADLVRLRYLRNPFIATLPGAAGYLSFQSQNVSGALGGLVSKIGNLDVTSFADGLAKFLVKRAKEELYISFFTKLQDSTKYPEFKIIFPKTKLLVDNFKAWEYPNATNTIREAFDKDLKGLLGNFPNIKLLNSSTCNCDEKAKKRIDELTAFLATENGHMVLTAFQIGNGFIAGHKLPDIFHKITGPEYLGGVIGSGPAVLNSIQLFDVLNYSLRNNEFGKNYVSKEEITALFNDADTRNIYLGLIYQQITGNGISFTGINWATVLTPVNFNSIRSFVINLVNKSDDITRAIERLDEARKKGEAELGNYHAAVFEAANQFLSVVSNIELLHPLLHFPTVLQDVFRESVKTLEIAHDIAVRNYNAAIISTLDFLSGYLRKKGEISGFTEFFVKYGSFAANIVQAKNSDDVERAIEAVVLPAGSASIKKKMSFSIALNGYLGGFYGNEYLAAKKTNRWGAISGMYAPVGITFSTRVGESSLSAFLSLIDIGAVASYRLKDDSTASLPEVKLQNILAPGLGLIYGIPRLPLSIGYTYQFGPALRVINNTDKIVSNQLNRRWHFFLAVDIPLANFYTRVK